MMQCDETTYKESFKPPKPVITKCKAVIIPEQKLIEPVTNITIDISSLTPYQVNRNAHIPFDLFWTPKPIVGQSSSYKLFKYDLPEKPKSKIKMTTVLSPCTPPEETSDESTYETIVKNMYLSTKSKADKDVEKLCHPRINTDSCFYQTSNIIKCNTHVYKKLPSKYIEMAKDWDNKNARWLSDRNKFFWVKYNEKEQEKNLSHENEIKLTSDRINQIKDLIKTDKLRIPHTAYKFGYGGYKPVTAYGVSLKKNGFPVDHPLTTLNAASYRKKDIHK